ncbi:hypothetical protein [Dialister succinatiphilus]|jgi:hypothetical protein|uniref:hypothetical protein n=1 Tax=Dialister succinatiphilus TaxID=487173 RepID=UPI0023523CE2|nr:hypothetical protein [Dialister succinatiphilus]
MRREGVILLDGLMALFLISALAMMVLPLAGSWLSALERGRTGTKLSETGLFAMDFMVEKIRNNRIRAEGVVRGNRYDYGALTDGGGKGTYSFFVDREKLKLQLPKGSIQPLTGEYTGPEAYAFLPGRPSLFRQAEGGPVTISFTMHHQMMGMDRDFETSVIPYADFYKKREVYE